MRILCAGGAGYIGAYLVPHLLAAGHRVTVLDAMWFVPHWLPTDNAHLRVIKGDVRNALLMRELCAGVDAVIWLASVSNNDMCVRWPALAQAVNVDALRPAVITAKHAGVGRFIYASSVAAYGSSDARALEETDTLAGDTPYGKGKREAERVLWDHQDAHFACTAVRAATASGYSPAIRLDTTLHQMAYYAVRRRVISVNGGSQVRAHIHLRDLVELYKLLLVVDPGLIAGEAWNAVAENATVMESAMMVARVVGGVAIEVLPRADARSYAVAGTKARMRLGFSPVRSAEDAVKEVQAVLADGRWRDAETDERFWRRSDAAGV